MNAGSRIVAEGQHPDGTWEDDPPTAYKPIRFSVGGAELALGDQVELLVQGRWLRSTFQRYCGLFVELSLELGYHEDLIEHITVPIDAQFRIPQLVEAA